MAILKNAHVHRFHDCAAISLPGEGATVYVLAKEARAIAQALNDCADDIEARSFIDSQFTTQTIALQNEGRRK